MEYQISCMFKFEAISIDNPAQAPSMGSCSLDLQDCIHTRSSFPMQVNHFFFSPEFWHETHWAHSYHYLIRHYSDPSALAGLVWYLFNFSSSVQLDSIIHRIIVYTHESTFHTCWFPSTGCTAPYSVALYCKNMIRIIGILITYTDKEYAKEYGKNMVNVVQYS